MSVQKSSLRFISLDTFVKAIIGFTMTAVTLGAVPVVSEVIDLGKRQTAIERDIQALTNSLEGTIKKLDLLSTDISNDLKFLRSDMSDLKVQIARLGR